MPKESINYRTLIVSARNKIIGLPQHCSDNHSPKNALSRIPSIVLREEQELPKSTRLNVFVGDFIVDTNLTVEQHKTQMSDICTLVARNFNGGLCKFSRLIPP